MTGFQWHTVVTTGLLWYGASSFKMCRLRRSLWRELCRSRREPSRVPFRCFLPDQRGTVTVEYTVILTVLGVGCMLAMMGLGGPLLSMFWTQQTWLLLPFP